jgi:hypothetical protein
LLPVDSILRAVAWHGVFEAGAWLLARGERRRRGAAGIRV